MGIFLVIAISLTLFLSIRNHKLFSFVTLGVIGAAIYSVPGVVDAHVPFYAKRFGALYSTPFGADLMVLVAWAGMMLGVAIFRPKNQGLANADLSVPTEDVDEQNRLLVLGIVAATIGWLGFLYLAWLDGWLFFLKARVDQNSSLPVLIWKWTGLLGLLSAILIRNRILLTASALLLFVIFLRGDRTMIAVTAAASMVALVHQKGRWSALLVPSRLIPVLAAGFLVFFGKSSWLTLKAGLSGQGWVAPDVPLESQFVAQFEPFGTYAHIGHVMDFELHIPLDRFFESIFANLTIFPSFFGLNTNVYNETVTATLPGIVRSGVAGSLTGHGWTVGGPFGVFVFYLIFLGVLRLCDSQFIQRRGIVKLFWGCAGGIISFYAHRNGMDNLLSFIRQDLIICVLVFLGSLPFKQLLPGQPTAPNNIRRPTGPFGPVPSAWYPPLPSTTDAQKFPDTGRPG
jgi:hypothetical protein